MIGFRKASNLIINPFLDEIGIELVDPVERYGFEEWSRGSGEIGLALQLDQNLGIWLQTESGKEMPLGVDGCFISVETQFSSICAKVELSTQANVREVMERKYLATWGKSFGIVAPKTMGLQMFSKQLNYSLEDQLEIGDLGVGEVWKCKLSSEHTVLRLS